MQLQQSSFALLILPMLCIYGAMAQTTPLEVNCPMFETSLVQTVIPTTLVLPPHSFQINPVNPLPTQTHRRPFVSLTSVEKLQTDSDLNLNMLTKITYATSSFTIELSFVNINPTTITSWTYGTPIKFYYMLISSSFPDSYISAQVDLITASTNFNNPPQSKAIGFLVPTQFGSTPFSLATGDTKFIFAITNLQIVSASATNSFAINIQFAVTATDRFDVIVTTVSNEKIFQLRISLFMFNLSTFSTYILRIVSNYYVSPKIPTGPVYQFQAYSGWAAYPGMQLILGLAGFQFANQPILGFEFSVDTSIYSPILTLGVKNFYPTTVTIPKLEVTLFSISQYQCPNSEPYINTARTACYMTCPDGTMASVSNLVTPLLKQCQLCVLGTNRCCSTGQYWDTPNTVCTTCPTGCTSCDSVTNCFGCVQGYFLDAVNSCVRCSTACSSCDATGCSQCQTGFILSAGSCVCPTGEYLDVASTSCLACSTAIAGCSNCSSSTSCAQCVTGYYSSVSTCVQCGVNCQNCDSTGCLTCQSGFDIFTDPTVTPSLVCKTCSTVYSPQCVTCNQTQCLGCSTGYFLRISLATCQALSSVVCGDGDWAYEVEPCDDANAINGDGCNSQCQVQPDYICNVVDKLATGASFCKFNKDFSLSLNYLEKDISSNTAHIFFKLQPPTFTKWTQSAIESLINPIQLVDSDTGNFQIIPVSALKLLFQRNADTNQIELIIDYGQYNLQNSFFQFNIQPTQTGLTSITHQTTQANILTKITSEKTGVYLYNYDQSTYSLQGLVQVLGTIVGGLALFMLVLGLCVPVGKLIILQALAVVQISYFSLLQFEKVPPTFVGLKNLILSNGYNDPNIFSMNVQSGQDIFKLMGLRLGVFQNENISLVLFLILPFLIGIIGFFVSNHLEKQKIQTSTPQCLQTSEPLQKQPQNQSILMDKQENQINYITFANNQAIKTKEQTVDKKNILLAVEGQQINQKLQKDTQRRNQGAQKDQNKEKNNIAVQNQGEQQNLNLAKIIFQRILYELTFYGILVTAYLSWVSILHSFSRIAAPTYILLLLVLAISFAYGFLFVKLQEKTVELNRLLKEEMAKNKIFPQKHLAWTNFGQFSQVYVQITRLDESECPKPLQKIYLVFLVERLLSSICIVLLPSVVKIMSVILIAVYTVLLVGLIYIRRKYYRQSQQINEPINDIQQNVETAKVTIKLELLQKKNVKKVKEVPKDKTNYNSIFSYLHNNYVLRQSINFITIIVIQIIYLYASIIMSSQDHYNTFVNNSIITKGVPLAILAILLVSLIFNLFLWIWQLKCQKIIQKSQLLLAYFFPQRFQRQLEQMRLHLQILSQTQREQIEVVKMLDKFMQTSAMFQSKPNPFICIEEKEKVAVGGALLDLFKVEEKNKFEIPSEVKKLRNRLIDQYWEDIGRQKHDRKLY